MSTRETYVHNQNKKLKTLKASTETINESHLFEPNDTHKIKSYIPFPEEKVLSTNKSGALTKWLLDIM